MLKAPIHVYRHAISPLIGPSCRFQPTCSAYALEAIEKHGPLKGAWLTARRLGKCHPVKWLGASEGYDPVPHSCSSHKMSGSQE
ncbi:MAG: membrane protein insertion efficiency factor YidD [Micropepsaceae bacterium]